VDGNVGYEGCVLIVLWSKSTWGGVSLFDLGKVWVYFECYGINMY